MLRAIFGVRTYKRQASSCAVTFLILHVVVVSAPVSNRAAADASRVTISIVDGKRVIRANGLPNHLTGRFPNRGNPNRISTQAYSLSIPAAPALESWTNAMGVMVLPQSSLKEPTITI